MKRLLPIIFVAAGAAGGVALGSVFQSKGSCAPEDAACLEKMEEEKKAAREKDDKPVEFVDLKRQFVVPVMGDGEVVALVVASLALEVTEGSAQLVFSLEPKLRDAFLNVLFVHAHSGGFDSDFTGRAAMADLRGRLNDVAAPVVGDPFRNVLITEIVRQDL